MPNSESGRSFDALLAQSGLPRAEARLLLGRAVLLLSARLPAVFRRLDQQSIKTWLVAHGDEPAPTEVTDLAQSYFARRIAGEPIAYLLEEKEFYGRSFKVGPGILIPRPETELLVEWGLEVLRARSAGSPLRVLDLGCGSGCIGISIALEALELKLNVVELTLVDVAATAIETSKSNAAALGLTSHEAARVHLKSGHWFQVLPEPQRFDLIVSNPPYIESADPHLIEGDLRFEPRAALASGSDGLEALREIVATAPDWLAPGGALLLEHGYEQATKVQALLSEAGFADIQSRRDLAGHWRVTGARLS